MPVNVMTRQAAIIGLVLSGAVLALGGCGSGGGSGGRPSAATFTTSSTRLPTIDVTQFASSLRAGLQSVSSAHVTLREQVGGQAVTGTGDETLASGKLTALDLSAQVGPIGQLRVLIVGNAVYVQLPPNTGKPWVQASSSSSDPVVRQLASALSSAQQSASIEGFALLASAAQSVRDVGPDTVSGQPAGHYDLTVDIAKLAAKDPNHQSNAQTLLNAGITSVLVQLWIDQQNRPVRVREDLTAHGQSVSVVLMVSNYNVPVSITAPPDDQISAP